MDIEEAREFLEYLEALPSEDEYFDNLRKSFLSAAVCYAHLRAQWALADIETRRSMNDERTSAHNAVIDWTNALGRFLAKGGEDVSWREKLGHNRKVIGDFACRLHAVLGISAR